MNIILALICRVYGWRKNPDRITALALSENYVFSSLLKIDNKNSLFLHMLSEISLESL